MARRTDRSFARRCLEYEIVAILSNHRTVGGDLHHFHFVKLAELLRLRGRGAGHSAAHRIQANQRLQGDGAQNASLRPEPQPLLGLQRGLQSRGPAPVLRHAAFELIHQLDGAAAHDVIHIAAQQHAGVQGRLDRPQRFDAVRFKQVLGSRRALRSRDPTVGKAHVALMAIEMEVPAWNHFPRQPGHGFRQTLRLGMSSRNDQGNASFVDQNRIGFIDQHRFERGQG